MSAPARSATPVPPMRAIAIAEDQRHLADIAPFLKSPTAAVRARAALAVGRLQDSTSVTALLPLLKDADARVRREAAFALGQIGHHSARAALEHSLTDADPEVTDLSLEALGKLGDKAATPQVVARLGAKSPQLRGDAAIALWRLADKSALGSLLAHLDDPVADVRWKVVYALEKLDDPRRIGTAVAPLLRDPDALVQAHAARTLGRAHAQGATGALVEALQSRNDAVVVNALRALQLIADSTDTASLSAIARLLAHPNAHVRVTAATALGDHFAWWTASTGAEANATSVLALATTDYDPATRGAAARSLIARLGFDGWSRFSPMLEDSSVYVRVAVLDGIRQMDATVVAGHAQPLADVLFASMRDVRPRFERMTAAEVAGTLIGRAQGKPHQSTFDGLLARLQALVDDPDVLIAASAAGALGDANDRPSVRHLVGAYAARGKDADADARIGIRDALRQLAGRAFADSIEKLYPAPAPPVTYAEGWELPPTETRAVLTTSAGVIEWRFLGAEAPQTVRNFITLAKKGYFDGLRVHRVVPDFVIQDGDPTGTGSGGPGYSIRCEYNHQRYDAGQVGMALSGKDTGGSQWFITLAPQPHLNGKYTIFAAITKGLDVARRITQGDIIQHVEILP
jgi:cyclophilin family peptidyl-prolyl cis-trans isomerase/HEAT repeat protein